MNTQFSKRTLAVIMAVGIGCTGLSALPAQANSDLIRLIEQLANPPRKGHYDHNPYRVEDPFYLRRYQVQKQFQYQNQPNYQPGYSPDNRPYPRRFAPGYGIRGYVHHGFPSHGN